METVKDKVVLVLILSGCILYGVAVFLITRAVYGHIDEKVTVHRDTIVMRDTIRVTEPAEVVTEYVEHVKEKPVIVRDTEVVERDPQVVYVRGDSVEIPIVQKKYADSTYTAWVSGYKPSLDSIEVYRKTVVQRETITLRKISPRWGIGVTGGYGYGTKNKVFEPFVGIGVYYRIL